ncbi:DMT family transporter [Acidipila sp. EB88]|uniref:DMT family transporter n=1 Tax=Acidipila sp. EB88 TaxID=2305226 RepID=UPI0018F78541|nr:EamA family transporter [Acidipila sp. EB88]
MSGTTASTVPLPGQAGLGRHLLPLPLAIAGSILFWASAYPAIRVGLRLFTPGQLAAVRFLVAGLCFALLHLLRPMRLPRGSALARTVLAGALGIAAYNLLLNTGEQHVSAGSASFLINSMPVFAALLAVLLGERLRPMGWLGVAMSFGA